MRDTDLLSEEFAPLQWAIRDLLPEGGILFGGPEKGGKSWLLLYWALCVAAGIAAFDRFMAERGAVLYLGYEDSKRRLQERLRVLMSALKIETPTGNLHLYGKGEWEDAEENGLGRVEEWLGDFPTARLVIIDPVNEFDPVPTTYKAGRKYMLRFVEIGERHHVGFVISTHMGKYASSTRRGVNGNGRSWRDAILGRAASAADAVIGHFPDMSHEPPETAVLKTSGKDVKAGDIGLRFDGGLWLPANTVAGMAPVNVDSISAERKLVLTLLTTHGPMSAQDMADARGVTYDTQYHLLADMRSAGDIERINGLHYTPQQAEALRNPPPVEPASEPTERQTEFGEVPYLAARQAAQSMLAEAKTWSGNGQVRT